MASILVKTTWGSDDPTRAAMGFLHANAFAKGGHDVRLFLLGEAVHLMRPQVRASVLPMGWPPLSEIIAETSERGIPIQSCKACSDARGVTEDDLATLGATFGTPESLTALVEWADKIFAE